MDQVDQFLAFFLGLPPWLLYLVLGIGAALENVIPPIPADTFVVLGAFLSARGGLISPYTVFCVTWIANTLAASAVYWAGRRYGETFFGSGMGRHLLNRHQMERIGVFYDRWGLWAIFFTRFLPGLRAVVPVFAGVSGQTAPRVILPILVASGIWHGLLVTMGVAAGRNLDAVFLRLEGINGWLLGATGLVVLLVGRWWVRTRRHGVAPDNE